MSEGYLLDRTYAAFGYAPLAWHPDKPVHSFWTGTAVTQFKLRRVVAFRCEQCAYVETYAP
jgi:hypothetical protein